MAEPLLSARGLTFRYEDRPIFEDLSLDLYPGEAVLLMGPSGCGKSSLAHCLAGLYPAYAGTLTGSLTLLGQPLDQYGPCRRAQAVSILFQNPDNQFCMGRPDHEILFALENIRYQGDLRARMRELLAWVGLESVETAPIHTLSGGTKQKLALATALATGARLLILDEPFANLDPAASADLAEKLARLHRQGLTLLVVDHRPDYWRPFLTRVMLMDRQGRLAADAIAPGDLEAHRADFDALGLFLDNGWLTRRRPLPLPQPETAMVEGEDVTLAYGKTVVARGLHFRFPRGGITALLGKNGSGKTTLLSAIAGVGKVRGRLTVRGAAGLVFQNPRFQFLTLSVEEEVLTTLRAARPQASPAELAREAEALLAEFDLLDQRRLSPYAISQGQQRKLALLSMLAGDRPLLLLDEPTYAQDERATRFILELLERRVSQGLTAVIATHDLALARACANRIYRMEGGVLTPLDEAALDQYALEGRPRPCAP